MSIGLMAFLTAWYARGISNPGKVSHKFRGQKKKSFGNLGLRNLRGLKEVNKMADPTFAKEISEIITQLSNVAQQLSGSEIGKLTYWIIWWKYLGYQIFRRGIGLIMFIMAYLLLYRKRKELVAEFNSDDKFALIVGSVLVFVVCAIVMFG
jgi:hypothetical protein